MRTDRNLILKARTFFSAFLSHLDRWINMRRMRKLYTNTIIIIITVFYRLKQINSSRRRGVRVHLCRRGGGTNHDVLILKWNTCLILSDPPFIEWHVRCTFETFISPLFLKQKIPESFL